MTLEDLRWWFASLAYTLVMSYGLFRMTVFLIIELRRSWVELVKVWRDDG